LKPHSISVVIATYNRAAMVREAVQAALGQTRYPEEIVVSDDASADDTPAVLAELAASQARVRVFRRETNSGGVENWNEAVNRAGGEYLALCSDDDRFLRDHLETSAAYLEAHPKVGFVHSGFIDVLESAGTQTFEPRRLRPGMLITSDDLLSYMTRYYDWPVHPSTIVMRREIWEQTGGFNPAYQLTDTDWFVRAVECSSAAYLPRHGVYNRRHSDNWSNRLGSARMQTEIFEIVERAIDRLWRDRPLGRAAWKAIWRANVRVHLGLTLAQRLKTGHSAAASALWHAMLQSTGRHTPEFIERTGERGIRALCGGKPSETKPGQTRGGGTKPAETKPSVSPL
jgi:glycosyltransferase involved in cell wall biosynthesis